MLGEGGGKGFETGLVEGKGVLAVHVLGRAVLALPLALATPGTLLCAPGSVIHCGCL